MKNVITFLLPGVGQLFSGDARKGGIMFISAVVAGAATGGIGYLACGAWSVLDLRSRTASPPSSSSSGSSLSGTARLLTTAEAPAPAGAGVFHAVMPWLFKFSVLGLCAFLVLNNVRSGGALQSLEAFGVRLHFASLANQAEAGPNAEAEGDPEARQAAFAAVANAYLSEQGAGPESAKVSPEAGSSAPQPGENASGPPGSMPVFVGQWKSDVGATYQIQEVDGLLMITETSRILFIPFVSMTCQGQSAGEYVRAGCTTFNGQAGELVLARDPAGGLGGIFTAYANGMQIPVNLRR